MFQKSVLSLRARASRPALQRRRLTNQPNKLKKGSLRAISTARLNMSPRFHLPPINVVVSYGP